MLSLSVVILNYNTFSQTCQCISSVYKSNKSIQDLEIILIDNGSEEKSDKNFLDVFPLLVYHKNKINLGFAKGNNIGIKLSTKNYVVLLNSDVIINYEDTLYRCIKKINDLDFPVILSPGIFNTEGKCQVSYGPLPSIGRELLLSTFIYKIFPKEFKKKYLFEFAGTEDRIIKKGWLVATCLFFKKDLIEFLPQDKLYDQTFLYGEELFWGYFWHKSNIRQIYYCQEIVTHLIGLSSKKKQDNSLIKRRALQTYGEYLFLKFRYNNIILTFLYLIRLWRLNIISIFDPKMKLIRSMTVDILFARFTQKYPFVKLKKYDHHANRSS